MFDAERWKALVEGTECEPCRNNAEPDESVPNLVATLPSGRVLLQDDADFRGYCILVYRRHATELFDLSAGERAQLIEDIDRVARAQQALFKPLKINYAILGNEVPHLHCHITPRQPADGWWGRPIWSRPPDQRRTLDSLDFERLRDDLRAALAATTE